MGKVSSNGVGFIDEAGIAELGQIALVTSGNLILRGETGTGKTYLAHWWAGLDNGDAEELWKGYGYKVPTIDKFSCHEEQGYVDIVAQDIIMDGATRVRKQILLQWLEPTPADQPKILLIDEANFLSPSVAGFLHPLCDWQCGIWVPELNQFAERSPQHWIILCMNPYEKRIYAGTKQMNAALASRFVTIDVPYMTMSAETKFLQKKFPGIEKEVVNKLIAFASKTRKVYTKDLLSVPVTPRNLIQWCDAMKDGKLGLDDIHPMILGVFPPDQHKQVEALLSGQAEAEAFSQVGGV